MAAANDPWGDLDERFRVEGPRKRQKVGAYKEGANGLGAPTRARARTASRRPGEDGDFEMDEAEAGGDDRDEGRSAAAARRAAKRAATTDAAREARANQWLDRECKALEGALYAYGAGADRKCVRAALHSGVERPPPEVAAAGATLLEMIERVGAVCKSRFDELEKAAAEAGPVERCRNCAVGKKGRCGTETAPKSCLKLTKEMLDAMNAEDERYGATPVGMDRATWEAAVKACDAVLAEREEVTPEGAAASLGRVNCMRRLAQGWQRAAKCLRERAALAAAVEAEEERGSAEASEKEAEASPVCPAERADFVAPKLMLGGMPSWWSREMDTDLMKGSLRHGFSPWSQDALHAQFEAIRADASLRFEARTLDPDDVDAAVAEEPPLSGEEEKEVDAPAAAGAKAPMPGRETLKRRLLRLLEHLMNPPAPKPKPEPRPPKVRKPTKAELLAEQRKKAAEDRIARDKERMKRDRERFEASLLGSGGAGREDRDAAASKENAPPCDLEERRAAKMARGALQATAAAVPGDVADEAQRASPSPFAPVGSHHRPTHVAPPASCDTADDPLTSVVLPKLTGAGSVPAAATPAAFKTPAANPAKGKAGGKSFKARLAAEVESGKQKTLFGLFAKTPAPAAAADRPRPVATPTTGGFA